MIITLWLGYGEDLGCVLCKKVDRHVYNIHAYGCFTWNHQLLTFTDWKSGVSTGQTHQNSSGMHTFIGLFGTGLLIQWMNQWKKKIAKNTVGNYSRLKCNMPLHSPHTILCFLLGNLEFKLEPLGWVSWGVSCFS